MGAAHHLARRLQHQHGCWPRGLHGQAPSVRLFKYLLSDYWEEFLKSTREWIDKNSVVLSSDRLDTKHVAYMFGLQRLYTKHVISDRCLRRFNGGLQPLTHVVADGVDAKAARLDVVKDFLDFVVVNDVLDGAPAAACPPPAAAPSPTELQQPGTPPGNLPKLQQPKAWPA